MYPWLPGYAVHENRCIRVLVNVLCREIINGGYNGLSALV